MVRAGWLLGLALLLVGPVAASAAPARVLPYALDRGRVALGEPLQLMLARAADSRVPALEQLDLRALERDFEILERTLGRDARQETLTLTLYPRRAGRYALAVPGLPGRAPSVTVGESSERVGRVHWRASIEPAAPWLRQPVTLTLEACDDGALLWKRPMLGAAEGLLLRPLGETEIITSRAGERCTAHRWHWALLPTASGQLKLPLPVVEAGKFGARLRYFPPALDFTVQPLPLWLPAEAAVGRPEVQAGALPAQAVPGQPLPWRQEIAGGYSAAALQALLAAQLRTADPRLGLERYAPQIDPVPASSAAPRWRVTLYLLPQASGRFELPVLQLPWYDPDTGLLQQLALPAPTLEVIDPQRARWLRLAQGLLAVLLATLLGGALWRWQGWRWQRRVAVRRVRRATDAEALHRALLAFSLRRGQPPAPTLQAWRGRMAGQCQAGGLDGLVETLERARYGGPGTDALPSVRERIVGGLRALRPR
jgi:hypothetical protein